MKSLKRILGMALMSLGVLFTSCDVHEFPEAGDGATVELVLDFTGTENMDFYKYVDYLSRDVDGITYDIRYVVNVYPVVDDSRGNNRSGRSALASYVFTKSDITDLNYSTKLNLPAGNYRFLVWADYVLSGTQDNLHYDASDFEEIILTKREDYIGNTDARDAFRGEKVAEIYANTEYLNNTTGAGVTNRVVVEMERPLAKFKFIATDVVNFLEEEARRAASRGEADPNAARGGESSDDEGESADGSKSSDSKTSDEQTPQDAYARINTSEYRVLFRYSGFVPCSFNMFTNRPADSWTGLMFDGRMNQLDKDNAELGFDYVFVNGHESTVNVSVEIYDRDGTLLARSQPVTVPLVRNKVTVVRGKFLTVKAEGGVAIDARFDGEYNYEYR